MERLECRAQLLGRPIMVAVFPPQVGSAALAVGYCPPVLSLPRVVQLAPQPLVLLVVWRRPFLLRLLLLYLCTRLLQQRLFLRSLLPFPQRQRQFQRPPLVVLPAGRARPHYFQSHKYPLLLPRQWPLRLL